MTEENYNTKKSYKSVYSPHCHLANFRNSTIRGIVMTIGSQKQRAVPPNSIDNGDAGNFLMRSYRKEKCTHWLRNSQHSWDILRFRD
ncbi:Hypothetical predicted protein [Octopus vulgaris]|uniref:Uncharacterized protein n=1 Tax=Octopus vulgaris TaxID=6645 RepID=A0AA36BCD9_OCTVU|nr:Hypothetical predicted protein [Octopus vulgaris]